MDSFMSPTPVYLATAKAISGPPEPGNPYSVALTGSQKPDRTAVYRHWRFEKELLATLDPAVHTAHEMFEDSASRNGKQPCFGTRPYIAATKSWGPYQWQDYATVQKRRANVGAGLITLHKQAGITQDKYGVGLWCQNRPEWQLVDLGCMSQSLYTVSIYDSFGPEASEFIIHHAELPCVAASLPHLPSLIKMKPRLPNLRIIVSLDPLDAGEQAGHSKLAILRSMAADVGLEVYTLDQVEEAGLKSGLPYNPPKPSDIVTINYTSGTTGMPKGVILQHSAAVAAATNSQCVVVQSPAQVYCSYLPLAHIYERLIQHGALWGGARIGFFHGNVLELTDDLKLLRPTAFTSVPRLFNRFGGAIRAQTVEQPGFKGALSRRIVSSKLDNMKDPDSGKATVAHPIYDRIWGRKVSAALGLDRSAAMCSGSAPLDPALHKFLRVVFGNHFVQGYGLTETYASSLCQLAGDLTTGNCGAVLPATEACLVSVPDMEYTVDDKPYARGELLLRGPSLFAGYYKNPEETAKTMTEDGWFRTGDIATVDSRGRFTIIDRRKNVLKLAQGEYVSPERLEGKFLNGCSYLAQAFVHGDSLQMFLIGLFGVQPDTFAPYASKILGKPIAVTDLDAIKAAAADAKVKAAVLKDLDRIAKKEKLAGYEKVKNLTLYLEPFTIENELLTPTLKLKRPQTVKKYRQELDALYAEALAEQEKPKSKL